jgi:hypothetical protein
MNYRYTLAAVDSYYYNTETGRDEYMHTKEISQDVMDWLEIHDVKIDNSGNKVYICNDIHYVVTEMILQLDGPEE